jgi:hypothetical protein
MSHGLPIRGELPRTVPASASIWANVVGLVLLLLFVLLVLFYG